MAQVSITPKEIHSEAVSKKEETREAESLMNCLRPSIALILAAGYANLQARQLLTAQSAQPMGEDAVMAATKGLATAFSTGSIIEFFISPFFGRISDRYGRKPLLLSFLIGPTIMRSLCVLAKDPQTRIRMLWLDFVSVRTVGVQPTIALAGVMISDAVPVEDQPRARAHVTAAVAVGQIVGNYAGGWWNMKHGPVSTFKIIACIPAVIFGYLSLNLSETHKYLKNGRKDAQMLQATKSMLGSSPVSPHPKQVGTIGNILRDKECLLLALTLALYEFMAYPVISTVANLFMKDRLGWNPLEAGRFSSAAGLAVFAGSTFSSTLMSILGSSRHVTFAHCCTCLSYFIWGTASSGKSMVACLFPMALGTGANTVLMTRFVARASSLGSGKGEAAAVIQAFGAIVRTVSPHMFMKLYTSALSGGKRVSTGSRLPLGSPMLLVSVMAILQEVLHQMLLRLQATKPQSGLRLSPSETSLVSEFSRQVSPA